MHADPEGSEDIRLTGSDTPRRMEYRAGTNLSVSLSSDAATQAPFRGYFDKLAKAGRSRCRSRRPRGATPFGIGTDRVRRAVAGEHRGADRVIVPPPG
jgi:pantothenate kinase type III